MEGAIEKLLKNTKVFSDNVVGAWGFKCLVPVSHVRSTAMLTAGQQWSIHFNNVFQPLSGEFDLIGKHPESQGTMQNIDSYQATMEELRDALTPELELIQSRIHAPAKEFQGVMKQLRKTITKREHKVRVICHSRNRF